MCLGSCLASQPLVRKNPSRREEREDAFKSVYAFTSGGALEPPQSPWANGIVEGVMTDPAYWDSLFVGLLSSNWPLERVALTDRACLRMAAYELWSLSDIPPLVTIKEYVALAEKFGDKVSAQFVNGVLSKLWKASPKAEWAPPKETAQESQAREQVQQRGQIEEPKLEPKRKTAWQIKSGK